MATKTGSGLEYKGVASISGPIIVVENVQGVGYDELVAVKTQSGETRLGKVIKITQKAVTYKSSKAQQAYRPQKHARASLDIH
jgi:vacuolar-type H+-ATPase subunit B/Vma2